MLKRFTNSRVKASSLKFSAFTIKSFGGYPITTTAQVGVRASITIGKLCLIFIPFAFVVCGMVGCGAAGGGGVEAASTVSNIAHFSTLREALHEIDLAIHSLMDALDTSIKAASTQLSLLTNIHDNFARAHPELLITYDTVIRSLQMFVNDNTHTGKVV